jgi:hypothetical protein
VTEPIPLPLALAMLIQLAVLTAVHEHCVPVITLNVRLLAVDATANVVGVTL